MVRPSIHAEGLGFKSQLNLGFFPMNYFSPSQQKKQQTNKQKTEYLLYGRYGMLYLPKLVIFDIHLNGSSLDSIPCRRRRPQP